MIHFEDFNDHKCDVVAQAAKLLTEAQSEYGAENITKSEFDEIAANIIDAIQIDKLANDVDIKIFIREAVDTLKFMVEHLPT